MRDDGALIYVYVEECVGVSLSAEQAGENQRERERSSAWVLVY